MISAGIAETDNRMSVCAFLVASIVLATLHAIRIYKETFIGKMIDKSTIIYNISWEDPRVERELVGLGPGDVILTISSAGCNVLDYLVTNPEHIVACDFNPSQLAILELKLASISCLEHAQFWELWSESNFVTFTSVYPKLREHILKTGTSTSVSTVAFWDVNAKLFKNNFFFAGSSGQLAKIMFPDYTHRPDRTMLDCKSDIQNNYWCRMLVKCCSRSTLKICAPLAGVPDSQVSLMDRQFDQFKKKVKYIHTTRSVLPDNYFYFGYTHGRWSAECCPPYMLESNFKTLKAAVARKAVTLVHGGWADGAQLRNDFTFASLLDSMDWMSDEVIAANLARLYPQLLAGNGLARQSKIFWRSFATEVHSPVLAALRPVLMPDDGRERVGLYMSQWFADVCTERSKDNGERVTPGATPVGVDFSNFVEHRPKSGVTPYVNTFAQDVRVGFAMAKQALRPQKDSVAFYREQADVYDGFREALLPDRDRTHLYCLPWHTSPKSWVSIGCGTARDIEYVVGHLKGCSTHLYLLDLSPELLMVAKERIIRARLSEQVTLAVCDILTAYDDAGNPIDDNIEYIGDCCKRLPPMGEFDIVTCSYCLTMIPMWKMGIECMIRMLKLGGTLSLVDFTKREDSADSLVQRFNAWWFSNDGVYLNNEHTRMLKNHPSLKTVWYNESESRVPYTPIYATHYIWTGEKRGAILAESHSARVSPNK